MPVDDYTRSMVTLSLVNGFGPVRLTRSLEVFKTPQAILRAPATALRRVPGIGAAVAQAIVTMRKDAEIQAGKEFDAAAKVGATCIARGTPEYPPLLAEFDDAPTVIWVRGRLDLPARDRYTVGIVGSRSCTIYGLEQAGRFAGALARAGLTVVSGGARGIDTAAHRGALDAGGRTVVVQGCGLAHAYPQDNSELYDRIVEQDLGAVISELPVTTAPQASNFPARNRIISALSLGVLVIEAGRKSGALITARLAAEEHGREVMALPGRVDSDSSRGALELIRDGGAAPVVEPADVVHTLENAARHHFEGTHAARFVDHLFPAPPDRSPAPLLDPLEQRIIECLAQPRSADDLATTLNLGVSELRVALTMLELQNRVARKGSLFIAVTK